MKRASSFIVFSLFLASVCGPAIWFNPIRNIEGSPLHLDLAFQLEDRKFEEDQLSEKVVASLSTTNIVNGSWTDEVTHERVSVFFAEWEATAGRGLTLINHTPEVCWAGVGWVAQPETGPAKIEIDLGEARIPFEHRLFRRADREKGEYVIWCAIVNGQVVEEPYWKVSTGSKFWNQNLSLARLALSRLWEKTKNRIPADGRKQFIRLSIKERSSLEDCVEEIKAIAEASLCVREAPL